jgi:hypothetical protein
MVDPRKLFLSIAAVLLVAIACATALNAADDEQSQFSYRLRTVDWDQPGTTVSAPYLAGYREIDPVRGRISVYKGKFLAREPTAHTVMIPVSEIVFEVTGGESDSDFVAVFCLPWFGPTDAHHGHDHAEEDSPDGAVPALPGTLLVSLDGGEPVAVAVEFTLGLKFFLHTGEGSDYSLPVAVIADVPEGDHEIAFRLKAVPAPFAVLVGGVPGGMESEAETAGDSSRPGG